MNSLISRVLPCSGIGKDLIERLMEGGVAQRCVAVNANQSIRRDRATHDRPANSLIEHCRDLCLVKSCNGCQVRNNCRWRTLGTQYQQFGNIIDKHEFVALLSKRWFKQRPTLLARKENEIASLRRSSFFNRFAFLKLHFPPSSHSIAKPHKKRMAYKTQDGSGKPATTLQCARRQRERGRIIAIVAPVQKEKASSLRNWLLVNKVEGFTY